MSTPPPRPGLDRAAPPRSVPIIGGDRAVVLTRMRRRHLRAVLHIEAANESRPWSLGLFMSELARTDARCYLVARRGPRVVGFGGLLYAGPDGHVTTLAVHPEHRRGGIGSRLLLGLCRDARSRGGVEALTLEVRATNQPAQALYRSFGFAPVGVRKNYYADIGEDALIMWAHEIDGDDYGDRLRRLEAGLGGPTVAEGIAW